MQIPHNVTELPADPQYKIQGNSCLMKHVGFQRFTPDVFLDHVVIIIIFLNIIDDRNTGMLQRFQKLRFRKEA